MGIQSDPERIDLIIIGGGPAGLSTALHLLKLDPTWAGRVLLLEKAAHPRAKLCGGGITRLGLQILADLGIPYPLPVPFVAVDDLRFVYKQRVVHIRGQPEVVIVHRPQFDAYLANVLRQQGGRLSENEPVQSLVREPGGYAVYTAQKCYHTRMIVGADGSNGIVRRTLIKSGVCAADQDGRAYPQVARTLTTLRTTDPQSSESQDRSALFDFTPVRQGLQGYFWSFPCLINGQMAYDLGLYDAPALPGKGHVRLSGLLSVALQPSDDTAEKQNIAGWPIHCFNPYNCFCGPHFLLVGDAAGVDPLFGEGIGPALAYGQLAAAALVQAFSTGDFSLSHYSHRLRHSRLGRYLELRWWVSHYGYRLSRLPGFMETIWMIGRLLSG